MQGLCQGVCGSVRRTGQRANTAQRPLESLALGAWMRRYSNLVRTARVRQEQAGCMNAFALAQTMVWLRASTWDGARAGCAAYD